jgi:hypothetical protein
MDLTAERSALNHELLLTLPLFGLQRVYRRYADTLYTTKHHTVYGFGRITDGAQPYSTFDLLLIRLLCL